ncbi:hypothetical protein [Methyloferula stellata]|uniref:hypothetical protein n=1 Tax=Methyloferula stellata TaxID=876270 RepID=UPI00039A567A|nr:hypothetical protein [Methyloferula stellata]
MNSLPFCGTRDRIRTLVACNGVVWVWPGIPLTIRRGTEIVPIAGEIINFWITRLHGPDALYVDSLSTVSRAARVLTMGDAVKAQHILDALKLTALSADGAVLMKVVAGELGMAAMNLPVHAGPRTWNVRDIALHCLLFKDHVEAARTLAKGGGGPWDEAKHPRWQRGAPDSQGGRFAPGTESGGFSTELPDAAEPLQTGRSVWRFKISNVRPLGRLAYAAVKEISRWAQAALELGEKIEVHNLLLTVEAIQWLNGKPDYYSDKIKASLDEPKMLKELQDAVDDPKPGYEIHHIVEQKGAEDDGFSREEIDARSNLVRIPAMKHREITGWYQTGNKDFGGLSPREYLRGKDWDKRDKVGIQALIKFGVLKP